MSNLNLRESFPIHRRKLGNGLDVIIVPKNKIPIISINLAYKVGSKDELPCKTGLAHLFEHLMFEGSKNVPHGDFDKLCSLAGGSNNAYTNFDQTVYTMTLPSHQLELGLWLESDRMMNLLITNETMETQQKVVTEEIHQTVFDTPYGKWREKLSESAYRPECSYSWEVHGKIEDVEAFKLKDLNGFFSKFYQPDNACLVLCGNIEPEEGSRKVEKYFDEIPSNHKKLKRNLFKPEYKTGGITTRYNEPVPLDGVFVSYHCPGFTDDAILGADILASIAGNGKSSRLYNSLVYKKQIASQIGAYVDKKEYSSLIIFYAIAANPEISCDALANELLAEIGKISSAKITKNEFEKTINQLTSQIASEMQYSAGIADIVASKALFWNEPERIYTILDKYKKVKIEDIEYFAQNILKPDNSIRVDALKS